MIGELPPSAVIAAGVVLLSIVALVALLTLRSRLIAADLLTGPALVVLGLVLVGILSLRVFVNGLHDGIDRPRALAVDSTIVVGIIVLLAASCAAFGVVLTARRVIRLAERYHDEDTNYRALVEQAPFGVYRVGSDGRMRTANPALVKLLGYTSEPEVLKLDVASDVFVDPADHARLVTRVSGPAWTDAFEAAWKRRDGAPITVRLSGGSLAGGEESGEWAEVVVEDVTPRVELQAQLRQAQKMEVVGQLTGGIAHDFNNLLTVIQANADSVSALIPGEQRDLQVGLEELQSAAWRGAALVRRLLGFSRRSMLALHAVDLPRLVTELLATLRRLLPSDIDVRFRSDDTLPAIHADPNAVEQILVNLATNARDAMPTGGVLTIETKPARIDEAHRALRGWGDPGEYVGLVVSDTGIGMDESTTQRVFEPFFTTKPEGKGTGLGLAIIYGLIKQHSGFVDVASIRGQGTTFTVYFPLASERAKPGVAASAGRSELKGGSETILMAEDEAPIRRAAKRVLERYGYTVLLAADGEEALRLFQEQKDRIDLVISDVVMPKMGGPQLYQAVQRESADTRFLFSSGYRAEDVEPDVLPEPSIPFLDKPWTVSELLVHVRDVLDSGRDPGRSERR